jgi:putative phosphoesterase
MCIAALYDIHGNLPALEAVLREVDEARPDVIVVGGDVVSGPFPRETLDLLLGLGASVRFIRGNADREVVAAFDGVAFGARLPEEVREITAWVARQLDRDQRDILAGWPETLVLPVDGLGDMLFCHGSPRSDEEILTAATPEPRLRAALVGVAERVVVCGHTHMQFDRRLDGVRVLNAGSVGMPYGAPGAYWLLRGQGAEGDLGDEAVALRHTPYDLERAAQVIRASGYPQAEDFAASNVLQPPTAAEATAVFERVAAERAG